MNRKFRAILSLILVLCLFTGICGAVSAVDASDGNGTQNDPDFTIGGDTEKTDNDYDSAYRIIVDKDDEDALEPDRRTAREGATITITIPDGISIDEITVLDKNDNKVKLTKVNDTTYTFVMPASDVRVSGTYEDLRLNSDDHFAYIQGYPDGTFKPEGSLTRAEAATIFYRLLLDPTTTNAVSFTDVADGSWYAEAVKVLAGKNVITGYPDGTFKPNSPVTRAEFCAMASRFFSLKEGEIKFTDVPESFWGYEYIASVVARGYLTDSETAYGPNEAITRAEVVTMVNRMLSRSADAAFIARGADGLKTFRDVNAGDAFYLDVMEAANGHEYKSAAKTETWSSLK